MAYQLEGYKQLFGDPYAKENKKKGHKVVDRKGQKWVMLPATADPTVPCRIQISDSTRVQKTKELFNTKNEDQDLGDAAGQTADRVFDEAVSEAEEEFDKFCTGMVFDEFKEEFEKAKKKAGERKGSDDDEKDGDDDEYYPERRPQNSGRHRGYNIVPPNAAAKKAKANCKPENKKEKKENKDNKDKKGSQKTQEEKKVKRRQGGWRQHKKDKSHRHGERRQGNKGSGQAGRKLKDLPHYATELFDELATADDTSQMFGEKSYTKLRAVSRNAQHLTDKINDQRTQSPERQEHEFSRKKLQIIETVIRAVRSVDAS